MQKNILKSLLLFLLGVHISFAADIPRLQRDLGELQGQLGRLQKALPTVTPTRVPTPAVKPVPKAIVRVYVMANAFIPEKDAQGRTKKYDKGLREGMLVPDANNIFYKIKNLDDMIKESGIEWSTNFATRTQKPHLTLVDFDIPIYDPQDQVLKQTDGLMKYLNATYAQPFRKTVLSKSIDSKLNFEKLDFLKDFFGARFKPGQRAQKLRAEIVNLVRQQYPQARLEFPDWRPHMSLYRLIVDPSTGEYLVDKNQLMAQLKQPVTKIEPFIITDKSQIQVTPEFLIGPKFDQAKEKFTKE
jgi:hypothetical protein